MTIHIPTARRHLFLDPALLSDQTGTCVAVCPPTQQQVVIERDRPWERAMLTLFLTVLDDAGVLKMWYSCEDAKGRVSLAYAESRDGVNWEKPNLGVVDYDGSTDNNLVGVPGHEGSVFIDPAGPAEARYVCVTNMQRQGVFRFTSPDGLRWQRDEQPLLPFRCDTQNVTFRDPAREQYVLYLRGWDTAPGWNDRLRRVVRLTLPALDRPSGIVPLGKGNNPTRDDDMPRIVDEVPTVFTADEHDPHETDVYNMSAMPYPLDPRWILAFPAMFRQAPGGCSVNDGRLAVHLAGSRDGITWHRYDRNPYVRPGRLGSGGSHMLFMGTGMVRRGDELWQYGTGFQTTHGQPKYRREIGDGVIYRYVQRIDGFASLDFEDGGGGATTQLVPVDGPTLRLNVDTSALGRLQVQLQDENDTPIPGFGFDDCDPITTNATQAKATWAGRAGLGTLLGRSVRLGFRGRRAKLFAFYFDQDT